MQSARPRHSDLTPAYVHNEVIRRQKASAIGLDHGNDVGKTPLMVGSAQGQLALVQDLLREQAGIQNKFRFTLSSSGLAGEGSLNEFLFLLFAFGFDYSSRAVRSPGAEMFSDAFPSVPNVVSFRPPDRCGISAHPMTAMDFLVTSQHLHPRRSLRIGISDPAGRW